MRTSCTILFLTLTHTAQTFSSQALTQKNQEPRASHIPDFCRKRFFISRFLEKREEQEGESSPRALAAKRMTVNSSEKGEMHSHSFYPLCTVKSQFNGWPRSAHFDSLNQDFTLNRDFLTWNFILVAIFCTLNRDFKLNKNALKQVFTVFSISEIKRALCLDMFHLKPKNNCNHSYLIIAGKKEGI